MLPHKSKKFIAPTAKKLECSENLVEDITSFYWQAVRTALSKPENVGVTVANFGVFSIKPWKLSQFMVKYEGIIKHTKVDTYMMYASIKQLEKKKLIVDNLIAQLAELQVKKQSVKEKRYGKGDKSDLEK